MIVLAIILAALLTQIDRPNFTSDSPASIEGIVVRAGTNQPIAGATVELTGIAARTVEGSSRVGRGTISVSVLEAESDGRVLSFTATTRSDGTFEITNVRPANNYQLIAIYSPEYLPAQYGQRVPSVPGRAIDLVGGQHLKGLRVEMTPGAMISGVVMDSRGLPIRNVPVELRRPWYLEGWRLLVDWNQVIGRVRGVGKSNRAARAVTNARGEFTFSGLAPAQYYIRTPFTDEEKVQPINLHAGASINDIRLVAPETQERTISGTIFGPNGTPSFARIEVLRPNVVPLYGSASIDDANTRGQFALSVPGPGRYVLNAVGSDRLRASARKEIEVGETDLRNVFVQLVTPFRIFGRVTFEGNPPGDTGRSGEMVFALYPTATDESDEVSARLPFGNGSFTLDDVTVGQYRVEVYPILKTSPPGPFVHPSLERAYVKSVRLDGKDILNGGLRLESPTNGTIEVVISMNGGSLSGRVLDSSGKPVPHVMTVLVPNSPRRARGDLYKYVSTDDSGRFQLNGLTPGDYRLYAWERVEEGAWQDPQFLRLFEELGSPVRINEGSRGTVDAKLILAWN